MKKFISMEEIKLRGFWGFNILAVIISFILIVIVGVIFDKYNITVDEDITTELIGSTILYFLPFAYLIWRLKDKKNTLKELFFNKLGDKVRWYSLFVIIISSIFISMGLYNLVLIPGFEYLPKDVFDTLIEPMKLVYTAKDSDNYIILNILTFISVVILAPLFEEIIFRGYLFKRFAKKWGLIAGAIIPAFIFGSLHGFDILGATVFGILMSYLYLKTKKLIIPIICHFINNFSIIVLCYLSYYIKPLKVLTDETINKKEIFDPMNILENVLYVVIAGIILLITLKLNQNKNKKRDKNYSLNKANELID